MSIFVTLITLSSKLVMVFGSMVTQAKLESRAGEIEECMRLCVLILAGKIRQFLEIAVEETKVVPNCKVRFVSYESFKRQQNIWWKETLQFS